MGYGVPGDAESAAATFAKLGNPVSFDWLIVGDDGRVAVLHDDTSCSGCRSHWSRSSGDCRSPCVREDVPTLAGGILVVLMMHGVLNLAEVILMGYRKCRCTTIV